MRDKFNYYELCDILYGLEVAFNFEDPPSIFASRETTVDNEKYSLLMCMYTHDGEMMLEIKDSRGNTWEGIPGDLKDSPLKKDFELDDLWEIDVDDVIQYLVGCENSDCVHALNLITGGEHVEQT